MTCTYCQQDPGTKPTGVWLGFRDADTGELVCWTCRPLHYKTKFKTPELRHTYSEMPVVVPPAQLTLQLKTKQ